MKSLFLSILYICFSTIALGQNAITGKVIDVDSQNVNGALITIFNATDSSIVINNSISDSSGNFNIKAPNGNFIFEINYLGIVAFSDTLKVDNDLNIGYIMLNILAQTYELELVEMKTNKPTVKLKEGNIVFTPNSIKSANTALDVLKITPLVMVRENKIGIIGKGQAMIKLNGKPLFITDEALINYLNGIPASEIENIIVAKNTFSETDAENKSGFIDIKLKQKLINNGVDGNLYFNATKATYLSQYYGASLNYYNEKIRWSNRIGFYNGKNLQNGKNKIHYPELLLEENEDNVIKTMQPTISSEFEYKPNTSNTFTLGVVYTYFNQLSNFESQSEFIRAGNIDSSYHSIGRNPLNQHNASLNLDYTHLYDSTGKSTNISLVHYLSLFDRSQQIFNSVRGGLQELTSVNTGNFQNMGITTLSIDNKLPTKFAQFSFGAKLTFISNKNNSEFYTWVDEKWNPNYSLFDNFNYFENTQALYIKANKSIKKWDFIAGLRSELTQTKGESIAYNQQVKRNFEMLFPSGNITYSHNAQNNYSLSYSRKVDRPGFYQVNPFMRFNNQYSYFTGNPFLQPYFSHNFDITYMRNNRWIYSLSYQRATNMYSEVEVTESTSINRIGSIRNFLNFEDVTFSINTNYNLFDKWSLYPDASISYYHFVSKDEIVRNSSSITGILSLYNQITLDTKEKWFLDISGFYAFANNSGVIQMRPRGRANIGITYLAFQKKLRINISANDLFKSDIFRYNSIVNDILRERYKYSDSRSISISVSYNFSKGKTKNYNPKNLNNQEEKNRIK